MYAHGLIGNCHASALIHASGSLDWLCFPRPDSPPVFGRLLDPDGGHFSIEAVDTQSASQQEYVPNTNILRTTVTLKDGSSYAIVDFCPRFQQHGRMYRPLSVFRIVEPLHGNPTIRVSCRPVDGWSREYVKPVRGNSHLRFDMREDQLRVITNMPLTYLCEETSFALKEKLYFGITWSSGIEEDLPSVAERFLKSTLDYWRIWVQHCSIPSLYQKQAIRSALALKLHCYEDTGAILAGLTSSLPEEFGTVRNWDYRFCWLRDAYFVLTALHNLGHFEETENFIQFLLNIAEKHDHSKERLRPVYRLDRSLPLPEEEHPNWRGFQSSRPVRSGNQAAEHVQNDVYGEMVLTLAPVFFDERFRHLRTPEHERLLSHLAKLCAKSISQPDAGLWEFRDGWREHSFSNLMCWAGLERIQRIQSAGYLPELSIEVGAQVKKAEAAVRASVKDGSLRNGPADESFDSSLLLLPLLRFPDDALCAQTVRSIHNNLKLGKEPFKSSFMYRYLRTDDFGKPHAAFLICSFWLVQALVKIGELEQAHAVMEDLGGAANPIGLLSEHFSPAHRIQTGNFPQAYSHVGLINAAFALSPPWNDIL